jgi:hypothetical protein
MRGIDEQMRIWKESNMFNLVKQQSPKTNKEKKKTNSTQITQENEQQKYRNQENLSIITLNVNGLWVVE